jgi:hypothetical protein
MNPVRSARFPALILLGAASLAGCDGNPDAPSVPPIPKAGSTASSSPEATGRGGSPEMLGGPTATPRPRQPMRKPGG